MNMGMGRKAVLEICRVCGGQARKINYVSGAKGKTYHYAKFIHVNGVVHYYRITEDSTKPDSTVAAPKAPLLDSLEEILTVRTNGRELRVGEIKTLLEESYGRKVGIATIYRNINKLLRLNLIEKRAEGGAVYYGKKVGGPSTQEIRTTRMSVGFDIVGNEASVTIFANITNLGLGLVSKYAISIPVGGLESLDQVGMCVFDETKRIMMGKENISYSWPDQTGVSITLSRPLRKSEEGKLFVNYSYKMREGQVRMILPSQVDFLRIKCEVVKGDDVQIRKRMLGSMSEIEPAIVKRTGTDFGHTIVEAEFENASKGETIVISLSK